MSINMQDNEGTIKISDEVIAVCAVNAALRTEGVASLAGGISNTLSRSLLGKDLDTKGIKVAQTEDGAHIDVHIIVKYHVKIPAVAWDIQENVKNEVQSMTGVSVAAVNIHVQGVEIPPEEEITNDEK